jgi:hypothetical protein
MKDIPDVLVFEVPVLSQPGLWLKVFDQMQLEASS